MVKYPSDPETAEKRKEKRIMNGFEYTISTGHTTLYISNKPRSGFVSFIVADKQPSLLDVKERNVEARFDVTESDFKELLKRLNVKAKDMQTVDAREVHTAQVHEPAERVSNVTKRKNSKKSV